MGDPAQSSNNFGNSRSRWAPKPEQIMILESIFNGSLVNPSKDETKGIRKVLEKYGPVVDTNVFYWFQNRRSRFRRQRRQNRESEIARGGAQPQQQAEVAPAIQPDTNLSVGFWPGPVSCGVDTGSSSSSSYAVDHGISDTWTNNIINNNNININTYDHDYNLWCSGAPAEMIQQEYNQNPMFFPTDYSDQLNYNPEMITVFINGVATEVKKERLHLRSMFGGDFLMYGSSSLPLQVDCNGFLVQCLEHGEHYYLVAT